MIINVEITGLTSLLMNKFAVDEQGLAQDKNLLPREIAQRVAFLDEIGRLYYPSINIYNAIIDAGKYHKVGKVKVTTARSSLIPSGLMMYGSDIIYFKTPETWEVDTRSVVIPSTGGRIIRHRPRLDDWSLSFKLEVDLKVFSPKFVRTLVDDAGSKGGLGDYRPSRKGIYGRFKVTKWVEEKLAKEVA